MILACRQDGVGRGGTHYPNHEEARQALFTLHKALKKKDPQQEDHTLSEIRKMIEDARKRRESLTWKLRLLASTAIGGAAALLNPAAGLLVALGFEIATRHADINKYSEQAAKMAERIDGEEHLTLLLNLEENTRRHFNDLKR